MVEAAVGHGQCGRIGVVMVEAVGEEAAEQLGGGFRNDREAVA